MICELLLICDTLVMGQMLCMEFGSDVFVGCGSDVICELLVICDISVIDQM